MWRRMSSLVLSLAFVSFISLVCLPGQSAEKYDWPLLFEDDFEQGAKRWQPTDPSAWKVVDTAQGKIYSQFKASKYNPPHRSPFNISLIAELDVTDFVLTAKAQSTCRDYPHQDLCLFFGYQDPAHFYYVHLGKRADPHSNQIMIVNGAPRKMITKKGSPGTPWDKLWHQVKIVRRVGPGTIEVYFDDMATPILTAVDKTFTHGRVGIGSFDDTGNWDDVKLYGVKAP